jgi:molybdopterin-synthase adenylyltransferase
MMELVLAEADAAAVNTELLGGDTEKCAVLYTNRTRRSDGLVRLLVREIQWPAPEDYSRRGALEAELNPAFVARVTKRSRLEGTSLVFVHSHPGKHSPHFSSIDWEGEEHLRGFLAHRHPSGKHIALVISQGGLRARHLGTAEEIRVVSVGEKRRVLFDPASTGEPLGSQFDRQIRAFGTAGQQALQGLRVAIVGLGGMGSLVAEQAVHLGVRDFILIDPDTLEATNLNRVANATRQDLDRPKVEIASKYIRSVDEGAEISVIKDDVVRLDIARRLIDADIIFGCTDSHGSRAVIQQVAYQYLIPYIDSGVTIVANKGEVTHIYGRVQLLAPGLACFACDGLLDSNEVRQDMMTDFERKADPYIRGDREPAPAVISLNGTVASLAVTMLLATVTELPVPARHVLYNGIASTMRPVRAEPSSNCYICSRSGSFARGDSWPLFARGS